MKKLSNYFFDTEIICIQIRVQFHTNVVRMIEHKFGTSNPPQTFPSIKRVQAFLMIRS